MEPEGYQTTLRIDSKTKAIEVVRLRKGQALTAQEFQDIAALKDAEFKVAVVVYPMVKADDAVNMELRWVPYHRDLRLNKMWCDCSQGMIHAGEKVGNVFYHTSSVCHVKNCPLRLLANPWTTFSGHFGPVSFVPCEAGGALQDATADDVRNLSKLLRPVGSPSGKDC